MGTARIQPKASIEDFEVLKAISEGAFGSAHLAHKVSSGDLFCIKRLRKARTNPNSESNPDPSPNSNPTCGPNRKVDMLRKNQVDHVKREQHILAKTRNPFVVKLYYSFQSQKARTHNKLHSKSCRVISIPLLADALRGFSVILRICFW